MNGWLKAALPLLFFSVEILKGDTIYVSNYETSTISRVTEAGVVTTFATVDQKPYGMAFATNGDLIVVCAQFSNRLKRITPAGVVSTAFELPNYFDGTALAFDPTGALFIASQGGFGVRKLAGTLQPFASGIALPFGLAFDAEGNLFVSDMNTATIRKVSRSGTIATFAQNVPSAHGLAFDAAGNLYAGSSAIVLKFTPAGVRATFAQGLAGASGLAFDTAGDLYVVEFMRQAVVRITPDGVVHPFASGFRTPQFVVVQPNYARPSLSLTAPGRVRLTGALSMYYRISYSEDLNTWLPLSTNRINSGATAEVSDTMAEGSAGRFYHARLLP
jgi:DNA-binding beta-propeller fold protein YncE